MLYKIIKALEADTSKKTKEKILNDHRDNLDLQKYFYLSLDPRVKFWIKKIPLHTPSGSIDEINDVLPTLDRLSKREVTGHEAIATLTSLLDSCTQEMAELVCNIIKKKPNCGVSIDTANDIWDGLVFDYPCLLGEAFDEKIIKKFDWEGATVEKKYDAKRANILVEDGVVTVMSRQGNEMMVLGQFDYLVGSPLDGYMIDGELIYTVNGQFASRKISNGVTNKCTKETISAEEASGLHLVAWDLVPLNEFYAGRSTKTQTERRKALVAISDAFGKHISLSESVPVKNMSEVNAYFARMLGESEEGCMLKSGNTYWEHIRSKQIIKFKAERDADVRVVGYNEGKDALEGNLGSLICATDDGKVGVDVSGFPLDLRSKIYANIKEEPIKYTTTKDGIQTVHTVNPGDTTIGIGSIIEIVYNEKIHNEKGEWSLFLPRFKKERIDKMKTNTFEELK